MKKNFFKYSILILIPFVSIELICFTLLGITNSEVGLPSSYIKKSKKFKTEENDCSWSDYVSHHPYLMIRYKETGKCAREKISDLGMYGEDIKDINNDTYKIILTGGSVAEGLYSSKLLEQHLNDHYISPNRKPFKLINGSISSGQQPRQAIVNIMLGDKADLVVSLEGFNELYNYTAQFRFNTAAHGWFQLEETLLRARENRVNSFALRLIASEIATVVKGSLVLRHTYSGAIMVQLSARLNQPSQAELEPKMGQRTQPNKEVFEQEYFKKYQDVVKGMAAISGTRNQKLIIFIQPIPEIGKELTKREKEIVNKRPIKEAYLKMINKLQEIKIESLYIEPLTEVFKDYKGELYADEIHYLGDTQGENILAKSMASYIAKAIGLMKK